MMAKVLRFSCEMMLLGILGLLLVRGLVFSWHRVEGPSMLPHYWGGGLQRRCPECGWLIRIASPPGRKKPFWAQCPLCSLAPVAFDQARFTQGELLLLPRLGHPGDKLRLWQPVLLHHPQQAARVLLKRIAGLPGQRVSLLRGNLVIDGQVAPKPARLWRQLLVLVHDSRYQHNAHWASGWKTDSPCWRLTSQAFYFQAPQRPGDRVSGSPPDGSIQWIGYQRRSGPLPHRSSGQPVPIVDTLGENQTLPRRRESLHLVNELWLECQLRWSSPGTLLLELEVPAGKAQLQLEAQEQKAIVRLNRQPLDAFPAPEPDGRLWHLGLAWLDGHLWCQVNGRLWKRPLKAESPDSEASRPVVARIGAASGAGQLSRVRLWRDVYYLAPGGRARYDFGRVPPGHVLVLGDNSFQSEDSRTWPSPWVPMELVLGVPLRLGP